jgi:hypothetical protein
MNLIDTMDLKLKGLFNLYLEKDFDIETSIMKEAGYKEEEIKKTGLSKSFSFSFFSFLIERLYRICLKEKKVINSPYLMKNLPKSAGLSIEEMDSKFSRGALEIYPGIILHKDIFIEILEKIGLKKTKETYVNWLLINDEEVDEKVYLSKNQIEKYKNEYAIKDIFSEEYNKKNLEDKGKVILLN